MARALSSLLLGAFLASVTSLASVACMLSVSVARAEAEPVRLDLRLSASDLVDEMVHTWLRASPFPGPMQLVIAEVDGPVGVDHRFEEAIENHLFTLLKANPALPVQLVHCSLCRQWVAVSNPQRTVIGRALSQPEALEQLRQYPHLHALSLHFEVVVNELVMWAEIYEIKAPQRVVWAQRYSTSSSARSVLQEPSKLVGIAEARLEQNRLLEGRDTIQPVTRLPIRNFTGKGGGQTAATQVQPILFLEQSFEAVLAPNRRRRAGLSAGITSLRGTMQGWSTGASFHQLLGRSQPSLTNPDLYLKLGVTYLRLEGPGAAVFGANQIDIARIAGGAEDPVASLTAWQIGVEAHVKYRFGFGVFIEYIPVLDDSEVVATERLIIPYHSMGVTGALFW